MHGGLQQDLEERPAFLDISMELPDYRTGTWGEWELVRRTGPAADGSVLLSGYWSRLTRFDAPYLLLRDGQVWMSTTAMEVESQQPFVAAAHGHTVICGLGMGVALKNVAARPEVERVTVLEKDPGVLAAFEEFTDAAVWAGWEKVSLVETDAMAANVTEPVDFLYVDIWPRLGQPEATADSRRVYERLTETAGRRPEQIGWWGQEFDFVAWLARENVPHEAIDDGHWRAFRAETGLPLVPKKAPGYARLAFRAVLNQMG